MLTVAFNVFDGDEWLPDAINSLREIDCEIIIVWQNTSNYGLKYEPKLPVEGKKLFFKPKWVKPALNELNKRKIALMHSTRPYFMCMDVDELYDPSVLRCAFDRFVASGHEASACQMQTYYKYPDCRLVPPETYWVPLFFRVSQKTFELDTPWPIVADQTRKIPTNDVLLFSREEIEMHHMSHVRYCIRRKLYNSSARILYNPEQLAKWHDTWTLGQKALLAHGFHEVNQCVQSLSLTYGGIRSAPNTGSASSSVSGDVK